MFIDQTNCSCMSNKFPEEKYIASVRCTREDIAEHFASALAKYFSEYRPEYSDVVLDGCLVEISTSEFTDLLALLPFYRASVSQLDGKPANEVDESQYFDSVTIQIRYKSTYWAQRCMHELSHIVSQYGDCSGLSNPVLRGNTASVICQTWDAMSALDSVIMKAGFGYSTYQEPEVVQEPKSGNSHLLVVAGVVAIMVIALLASLV